MPNHNGRTRVTAWTIYDYGKIVIVSCNVTKQFGTNEQNCILNNPLFFCLFVAYASNPHPSPRQMRGVWISDDLSPMLQKSWTQQQQQKTCFFLLPCIAHCVLCAERNFKIMWILYVCRMQNIRIRKYNIWVHLREARAQANEKKRENWTQNMLCTMYMTMVKCGCRFHWHCRWVATQFEAHALSLRADRLQYYKCRYEY